MSTIQSTLAVAFPDHDLIGDKSALHIRIYMQNIDPEGFKVLNLLQLWIKFIIKDSAYLVALMPPGEEALIGGIAMIQELGLAIAAISSEMSAFYGTSFRIKEDLNHCEPDQSHTTSK